MKISHLSLSRHGVYYFRFVTPPDVRRAHPTLPREMRRSLGTRDPRDAAMHSTKLALQLRSIIACLRSAMQRPEPEVPSQFIIEKGPDGTTRFILEPHDTRETVDTARDYIAMMVDLGVLTLAQAADPMERLKYCKPTPQEMSTAKVAVAAQRSDKWLSEVIDLYGETKQAEGSWTREKTWTGTYAPILRHFRELISKEKREVPDADGKLVRMWDIRMHDINDEHIRDFIKSTWVFPANVGSTKHGKNLDAKEALLLPDTRPQHQTTAFKSQRMTKSFLRWAIQQHLMAEDWTGIFPKEVVKWKNRAPTGYIKFEDTDLQRIFERDILGTTKLYPQLLYWGPLLALYTGARVNELCQLLLDDVVMWQGRILCFNITDLEPDEDEYGTAPPAPRYAEGEESRVKNTASRRWVPVHPKLLELGFTDYVAYLKEQGHKQLFPDAAFEDASGYGRKLSRHWQSFSREIGVWRERKKVFHSFRATLNGRLTLNGVALDRCELILGHTNTSTNRRVYTAKDGSDVPVHELFGYLSNVDFGLKHQPWTRPVMLPELPKKL